MNSQQHWEDRYENFGDSGYGSYGIQATKKLRLLKQYIPETEVKSICDFGCGDFYFGSRVMDLYPTAYYLGVDQSKWIIERNKRTFNQRFIFEQGTHIEQADLLLCIDVLLHVLEPEDEAEIIAQLKAKQQRYLVVTAFDYDGPSEPNGQAVCRRFPEELFTDRALLVKEQMEPQGLSLYIWKK